jgi:hypothetical protein
VSAFHPVAEDGTWMGNHKEVKIPILGKSRRVGARATKYGDIRDSLVLEKGEKR